MDIEELLKKRLESHKEEERVQAVREFASFGSDLIISLLYQAMGDSSWRVRKEAAETFLSLPRAGELAGDIVELLHSQDNAGLRNIAVDILVQLNRQAVPVLLEELQSIDHDVRKFVLDILGDIGDTASTAAMIAAMSDDDRNVRAAAAENLGKIGAVDAVSALLDAMSDADLLMRFTILEALGKIGKAIPIDKILPYKEDPLLRQALFECIGRANIEDGIPLLVEGLSDRMRNVREAAALSLAPLSLAQPERVSDLLRTDDATAPALTDLLHAGSLAVVRAALKLIPLTANLCSAPPLLAMLDDEELQQEVASALIALGRPAIVSLLDKWSASDHRTCAYISYLAGETGCTEAVPALLSGLSSEDLTLRMSCAQALGRLNEVAAVPCLVEMLQGAAPETMTVAQNSLIALASAWPDEIVAALSPLVEDEDAEIRAAAIGVLGRINYKSIENFLDLALKDESSMVRRAAVNALGSNPADEHLDVLMLALTDEDSEVRRGGAEALGTIKKPQSVDALALALFDEDLWVRATVIRSLGKIKAKRSVSLIKEALGDPIGLVCIAALEALAELDPEAAFPLLIASLYHDDQEVVDAALQQLVATGRRDWLASMTDVLLNHDHWEVRLNYARALESLDYPGYLQVIEDRLVVEGEALVRQQLEAMLNSHKSQGGLA
ncbi:HEAT repeat domain-containing protein [Trichloromonas sp.]|uniref:HEAT repeat domain-containing protein n=1 Tax=Trichloromonas sp. TaxID=3069249 RepID=UPI003D8169EF